MNDLAYLIRDLAILIKPYMPETSEKISALIGIKELKWDELWNYSGISKIERPSLLFKKLEEKEINSFRKRFSGRQEERKTTSEKFTSQIDLRVAKIISVERHPKADKLYIEKIDLGTEKKQIVSGLVPYYTEDELIGRNIILAYNLKSAKLRGVLSQGMLLAAENDDTVEVVFVEHANPGDRVVIEGNEDKEHAEKKEITIDEFFNIPIKVENHVLVVENKPLVARGKQVVSWQVKDGVVG
jgi:methionyl-tRNA synthetase